MKQNSYSDSFKVFLGLNTLLILGNLFLANDYATLWNGSEASLLLSAQNNAAHTPVSFLYQMIYESAGLSVFSLRLPGVLTLLLTIGAFFVFGKKIFGRDAVVLTSLIALSSFVLMPMAKFAGGDIYLLLAQLLHLIFTILFIKQPLPKWRNLSYATLAFGMLVHPLSMGIWGLFVGALLFWRHAKQENAKRLFFPIGLALVILPLAAHAVWGEWTFSEFTFSFGQLSIQQTLFWIIIGLMPWLGILPAAFVDLYKKGKTGEELSIIITAWLGAALFSQSLSLVVVLAFMIAKQIGVMFKSGYPYLRLVKGFSLLNLLSTFILVFLALLGGLSWVGVEGYRPLLGICFVYWVFSLLGVIGLFMKDWRVVTAGAVFSGLVSMLLFWSVIYPLWDNYRKLPQEVTKNAKLKNNSGVEQLSLYKADWMTDNFMVYANESFSKIEMVPDSNAFKQQLSNPNHQVFIFDNKTLTKVDSTILKRGNYADIPGGWGRMGSGVYIVGE